MEENTITLTGWDKPSRFRELLKKKEAAAAAAERRENLKAKLGKIAKKLKPVLQKKMRVITVKSGFKKAPHPQGRVVYGSITRHDTSHLDNGQVIPRQQPRRIRWV